MNDVDELDGEIRRMVSAVGDAAGMPPRFDELEAVRRGEPTGGRARVAAGVVAAATVAAAIAGVVVVRWHDREPQPSAPAAPGVQVTAARPRTQVTAAPTTVPSSTSVLGVTDASTVWFLPSTLPPGYDLVDVSARTDAAVTGAAPTTWVERAPDGVGVAASVSVRSTPSDRPVEGQVTVHGRPGDVSALGGDGTSWHVAWVEDGALHAVAVRGHSMEASVALAERSTVTGGVADLGVAMSELGYELLPAVAADPTDTVFVLTSRLDGSGAIGASISHPARPLDEVAVGEDERRVVAGVEVSIATNTPDDLGPYTEVRFVRDGWLHTVIGRNDVDTVLGYALDLEVASQADAAAAVDGITARALGVGEVDRATFGDGTVMSVRSSGAGAAAALCVEVPVVECRWTGIEPGPSGDGTTALYELFDSGDGRFVAGWQPPDRTAAAADGTPVATSPGTVGTFLRVEVTGAEVPMLELAGTGAPVAAQVTTNRRP